MSTESISAPVKLEMLKLGELSDEQKTSIQRAAQFVVIAATCGRRLTDEWLKILGPISELHVMGMFTTLTRGEQLRGCCGFLGRPTPLQEAILSSAERTAKDDPRMPPISPSELPFLRLDVSVLSSPIALAVPAETRPDHIEIGRHGLKITRGQQTGLLLPSVPVEQKWTVEQFLEGVCRKAGLPESAWKDGNTLIETFEGVVIEGKIDTDSLPSQAPMRQAPGDIASLQILKQVATQNLIALSHGATPTYFAPNAMDGNVNGIVLSLVNTETSKPLAHWIKTSLRNDIPLQSSLFELCKAASDVLAKARFQKAIDIELAITVLYDSAHHGSIQFEDWDGQVLKSELSQCETAGLEPSARAVVAVCGDRAAVAFDAEKSVGALLGEAAGSVRTRRNPIGIYSMGCMSTASSLLAHNATVPYNVEEVRPPAIADGFYPSNPDARKAMVAKLREKVSLNTEQVPALAIMTPHAGLGYSGQIAMDVWSQVKLPSTLLVFGPKHTSLGSDWAVSPATAWELPGGERFQADIELMKKLADGVEGFELDFAAHSREHGTEIQLPILESLCSVETRPKIVAVALKSASLEEIMLASEQLANVLRDLPERPLLVISSDMNHYAPEAENRRRDRLALDAIMTGDPKHLIQVCRENFISMCGVVPAAIVMQTMHNLGDSFAVEEVSYDNSASNGGDPNRVVGYAGVVFKAK